MRGSISTLCFVIFFSCNVDLSLSQIGAGPTFSQTTINPLSVDIGTDDNFLFQGVEFDATTINTFSTDGIKIFTTDKNSCTKLYLWDNDPLTLFDRNVFSVDGNMTNAITVLRIRQNASQTTLLTTIHRFRIMPCDTSMNDVIKWEVVFYFSIMMWAEGNYFTGSWRSSKIAERLGREDEVIFYSNKTWFSRVTELKSKTFLRTGLLVKNDQEKEFLRGYQVGGWMCGRGLGNGSFLYDCGDNYFFYDANTGVNTTYVNWAPGEPRNLDGCVYLELDGTWTTKDCSLEMGHTTRTISNEYSKKLYGVITIPKVMPTPLPPTAPPTPTPPVITLTPNSPSPTPNTSTTPLQTKPPPTPSPTPPPPPPPPTKRSQTARIISPEAQTATASTTGSVALAALAVGGLTTTGAGKATLTESLMNLYNCSSEEMFEISVAVHPSRISLGKPEDLGMVLGAAVINTVLALGFLGVYYLFNRHMTKEWDRWISRFPFGGLLLIIYFFPPMCNFATRLLISGKGIAQNHIVGGIMFVACLGFVIASYWLHRMPDMDLLYMQFKNDNRKYAVFELAIQFILGVLTGLSVNNETFCDAQLVLITITLCIHAFVLAYFAVYESDYERWTIFLVDLLFASGCVCLAVGPSAVEGAKWSLLVAQAVFTLFAFVKVAFQFRRFREVISSHIKPEDEDEEMLIGSDKEVELVSNGSMAPQMSSEMSTTSITSGDGNTKPSSNNNKGSSSTSSSRQHTSSTATAPPPPTTGGKSPTAAASPSKADVRASHKKAKVEDVSNSFLL